MGEAAAHFGEQRRTPSGKAEQGFGTVKRRPRREGDSSEAISGRRPPEAALLRKGRGRKLNTRLKPGNQFVLLREFGLGVGAVHFVDGTTDVTLP